MSWLCAGTLDGSTWLCNGRYDPFLLVHLVKTPLIDFAMYR